MTHIDQIPRSIKYCQRFLINQEDKRCDEDPNHEIYEPHISFVELNQMYQEHLRESCPNCGEAPPSEQPAHVSPSPVKAAKLAVRKDLFGHSKEDRPEEGQEQEVDPDHSGLDPNGSFDPRDLVVVDEWTD